MESKGIVCQRIIVCIKIKTGLLYHIQTGSFSMYYTYILYKHICTYLQLEHQTGQPGPGGNGGGIKGHFGQTANQSQDGISHGILDAGTGRRRKFANQIGG